MTGAPWGKEFAVGGRLNVADLLGVLHRATTAADDMDFDEERIEDDNGRPARAVGGDARAGDVCDWAQ